MPFHQSRHLCKHAATPICDKTQAPFSQFLAIGVFTAKADGL